MKPKSRAAQTASRYSPMLVGEVRSARLSVGESWRLSTGSSPLSGPTVSAKKRQSSRAHSTAASRDAPLSGSAARRGPASAHASRGKAKNSKPTALYATAGAKKTSSAPNSAPGRNSRI